MLIEKEYLPNNLLPVPISKTHIFSNLNHRRKRFMKYGVISKLKMYKKWQCWMYNFWQYAMYRFNILLTISILLFYFIFFIKKSLSVIHSVTVPFKLYHLTMIKQSVKYCCCQHLVIKCFCPLTGGFVGCDYH